MQSRNMQIYAILYQDMHLYVITYICRICNYMQFGNMQKYAEIYLKYAIICKKTNMHNMHLYAI